MENLMKESLPKILDEKMKELIIPEISKHMKSVDT